MNGGELVRGLAQEGLMTSHMRCLAKGYHTLASH